MKQLPEMAGLRRLLPLREHGNKHVALSQAAIRGKRLEFESWWREKRELWPRGLDSVEEIENLRRTSYECFEMKLCFFFFYNQFNT